MAEARVLDGVAFVLLALYALSSWERPSEWIERRRRYLLLFSILFAYALLGFVLHGHRSSIVIAVLALLALQFAGRPDFSMVTGVIKWLIAFHIAAFAVQFFTFHLAGANLDYLSLIGRTTRTVSTYPSGRWNIRATGLFVEPNNN